MLLHALGTVSIVVLTAVVLVFTGLPGSLSALILAKTDKSCCDECNKDEAQDSGSNQCSTPDCPIFVCLSMDIDSPFILSASFQGLYIHFDKSELVPKPLPKLIFHPPKNI